VLTGTGAGTWYDSSLKAKEVVVVGVGIITLRNLQAGRDVWYQKKVPLYHSGSGTMDIILSAVGVDRRSRVSCLVAFEVMPKQDFAVLVCRGLMC
jgi:hypothetical protein